jgi:hypothetical protein
MTNAVSGNVTDRTRGLAQKAMTEHRDLTGVFIAGIIAAVLMRYVTAVATPAAIHAVLAVVAAGAIVCAYLLLARSKVSPEWKLVAAVAAAVVSAVCFRLLSMLMA